MAPLARSTQSTPRERPATTRPGLVAADARRRRARARSATPSAASSSSAPTGPSASARSRTWPREAERRAARTSPRAGLEKGDRVALVMPDGDEFVLSFLGALFAGRRAGADLPAALVQERRRATTTPSRTSRARPGRRMLLTTAATRPYVDAVLRRGSTASARSSPSTSSRHRRRAMRGATSSPDDLALPPVHERQHVAPEGRHGHARQPRRERRGVHDPRPRARPARRQGRELAAALPRHGAHRLRRRAALHEHPVRLPADGELRRARPRMWLDKIHQHRGTITYAPNFAYALVAKRLKDKDVAGPRSVVPAHRRAAAPSRSRPQRSREFAATLAPAGFDPRAFLPSYGMAEATLAITFAPLGQGCAPTASTPERSRTGRRCRRRPRRERAARSSTAAARSPVTRSRSSTTTGNRLGERQVGQIVARGPSVTPGLLPRARAHGADLQAARGRRPGEAPWLHTGDLGYTRRRPALRLRAREGHHHRPRPQLLPERHRVGRDASVAARSGRPAGNVVAFGVFVDAPGARPQAAGGEEQLVVCCEGHSSEVEAIRGGRGGRACASRFGLTVHEVVVAPLASLPRTSSGKPKRRETRQTYLDGSLVARTERANRSRARPSIRTITAHGAPG